jgi:LysM domain
MTLRETLRSPWLTASLAVVAVALLATIVALPQILATLTPMLSPTGAVASPSPSPSPSPAGPTPVPTFARPTPSPAPTFISYTVRRGDTLTSIATTYHTTARSIAWWNRGTYPSLDPESASYEPNRIEIGWILVMIPGSVVDDTNPPTPSPGPATPSPAPLAS